MRATLEIHHDHDTNAITVVIVCMQSASDFTLHATDAAKSAPMAKKMNCKPARASFRRLAIDNAAIDASKAANVLEPVLF